MHLGYGDVAHLAFREAMNLADHGDDELLPAALRCSMAWLLLTQGRFIESHRLATAAAAGVTSTGDSPAPAWSVYGSLLLTGATAAGRADDRPVSGVLLDEAEEAAGRTGAGTTTRRRSGPTRCSCRRWTSRSSPRTTTPRLRPPSGCRPTRRRRPRPTRHLSDVALAHTRLGHDGAALDALLRMEQIAPTWTKFQAQPRQIVRELRERATPPLLSEVAERMGVRA